MAERVRAVDIGELKEALAQAQQLLPTEIYDVFERAIKTLIETRRLLRDERTAHARLCRLFGMRGSEKSSKLFDDDKPQGGPAPEEAGPNPSPDSGTGGGDRPPHDESKGCGQAPHDGDGQGDGNEDGSDGNGDRQASPDSAGQGTPGPEPKPKPKGHGRRPASDYSRAKQIHVPHDTLRAGDRCPNCGLGKVYKMKDPARFLRIVGQEPLTAECYERERLRCNACQDVHTAPEPEQAKGPRFTPRAAAVLSVFHYYLAMPFNRLERFQDNLETPLPSSTQWDALHAYVDPLMPAYGELLQQAAQGKLMHNDDTHMPILEYMGKRRAALLQNGQLENPDRTGMYTTAIVSVLDDERTIALFFTGRDYAGENLTKLLERRSDELTAPFLMCDAASSRNLPVGHQVIECNCLVHGRRQSVDELKSFPEEVRFVVQKLAIVFGNERICKERDLDDQERLELHQQHSGPAMEQLWDWIQAQFADRRIEPNSGMGKALRYLTAHWHKLTVFLRIPGAPIENNIAERTLKIAIRGRRTWLFFRSPRGAEVGDVYRSLIYTCELHRANPIDYLTALLENANAVRENPADWMPWNFQDALFKLENATSNQHPEPVPPEQRDRAPTYPPRNPGVPPDLAAPASLIGTTATAPPPPSPVM